MTITCDGQCPKFDGTGCELLLYYDKDRDGKLSMDEVYDAPDSAKNDKDAGLITREEFAFVADAYFAGTIDKKCEGCGTEETITCDGQCPKFDGTGCELLLYYDTNDDGIIDDSELNVAFKDAIAGTITADEYAFIRNSYNIGSINALPGCSGCYSEEGEAIFRVTEFTAPSSCEAPCNINIHIKWQNVGTASGSFIPKYEINSVPYTDPQQTLAPNATYTIDDTVSITSAGTYEICPYPNE